MRNSYFFEYTLKQFIALRAPLIEGRFFMREIGVMGEVTEE